MKEDEEFVKKLMNSKNTRATEEDFSEMVRLHLQEREKLRRQKEYEKQKRDAKLKQRLKKNKTESSGSRPGSRNSRVSDHDEVRL